MMPSYVILSFVLLVVSTCSAATSVQLPPRAQAEAVSHASGSLFLISDIRSAAVFLLDVRTSLLATVIPGNASRVSLGMSLQDGLLFVAGGGIIGSSGTAAPMFVYHFATGRQYAMCEAPPGAFLNDVTSDSSFAYFTDSARGTVYKLDIAALPQCKFSAITLPSDKFPTAPFIFTANGIVRFSTGLIIANTNQQSLFYTDIPTNQTQQLLSRGMLPGADGLDIIYHNALHTSATLFVAQNSQNLTSIWRVYQRHSGQVVLRFIRNLTDDTFDTPTSVAVGGGRLVVANARFGAAPLGQPLPDGVRFSVSVFRFWTPFSRFWFWS